MTTTDIHPTEARLRAAIIAAPADECVRLALADWLEEQGRHEQADRVRETSRIRPEGHGTKQAWLWDGSNRVDTNGEYCPLWLFEATRRLADWPSMGERYNGITWEYEGQPRGMAAILDAILEDQP